ncbi:hypothetical protein FD724_37190 (plasmid) [Nostoc sp. C057]|uniref:hypothetical protein n=1 Tax=Nostoc sp. C057 TaxID=2576903 RepID=UPI0015C32F12|nr:hypothetical protein [Nostoc sp. C057]QLE53523.1 hypothetical protein FD724_37190 [Nostoc sp. C057]
MFSELVPTTLSYRRFIAQQHESPIIYAANDVNSGIVPTLHNFNQVSDWMDVGDFFCDSKTRPKRPPKPSLSWLQAIG